jgi:hypothetical protein
MKLLYLILLAFNFLNQIKCELRFVFEMFRHGARTPFINEEGKDAFGEIWSGDSELTPLGMRMHYLLGIRNREIYKDFLSKQFDPNEIYIMSTDRNRTIMSAYSQLMGLYPPETGPVIPKGYEGIAEPPVNIDRVKDTQNELGQDALKYRTQIFPIHIIPSDSRTFYLHDKRYCEGVKYIVKENEKKESIKIFQEKFLKKYGEPMKTIFKGKTDKDIIDLEFIWRLADSFSAGYTEGRAYKILTDNGIKLDEFNEIMEEYLILDQFDRVFDDRKLYIGTMSMSPLHRDILEWMETRIKHDKENKGYITYKAPKFVMLSGHDVNISAMQAYMFNVFKDAFPKQFRYPEYASSFYYELFRKNDATSFEDKDYEVIVKMNDYEFGKIEFVDFKKYIEVFSIKQNYINDFCGFETRREGDYIAEALNTLLLLLICAVLGSVSFGLIVIIIWLYNKMKREAANHVPITNTFEQPMVRY